MLRYVAPVVILVVLGAIAWAVLSNPPEVNRRGGPEGPRTIVEVMPVVARDFSIQVASYGTVKPRTQSFLVAQVPGQVVEVNPSFRPGGFFKASEPLALIDERDYVANVNIADAALMDALQAEAQERARAEQAEVDWQRLGEPGESPSDLVLRIPQRRAAEARVSSARSNLAKAKLNLERTRINAPFDGRVLRQMVDLGQVVNSGTQIAEVYATDYVEVRLPIRNSDLAFVDLPEDNAEPLEVKFRSELGEATEWTGKVVRTEGAIDEVSRQLHVVAQILDPFVGKDGQRPLKIGEYVTAEITGRTIEGALIVPTNTIYQNSYVYIVEDELLRRRDVELSWQDGSRAVISRGLDVGDRLVTTPLGQVASGTRVRINGSAPARRPSGEIAE